MQGDITPAQPHGPAPKPKLDEKPPQADVELSEAELAKDPGPHQAQKERHHFDRIQRWWGKRGKTQRLTIGGTAGLLIGAVLIFVGFAFVNASVPTAVSNYYIPHVKPKPKTVASPLTGVQVDPVLAKRPVTGVMIENSFDARPQSGLQAAGVVYEAVAEGGVTRFLALFQESRPQYIGPVRSLRPYFLDFAAPFQASIAHVGGSPDALAKVRNGHYRDIDEFFNAGYYWRINSRYAPHNVYTSFAKLDALNKSKGYRHSSFTSWPRKPQEKLKTPTAKTINFLISGPAYYVHYDYDAKTSTYLRSEGGDHHIDLVNSSGTKKARLHPKVVIALIMGQSYGKLDASGAFYTVYDDNGSGRAYIFQDGGVKKGLWKKNGTKGQISFISSAGKPIKLDAGQTWLTVLGSESLIKYSAK
ncbi:MAG TPA: DUF3048 domain-containing protein [Candidatus Saccharimonadales bacterium]|nr:DUF3048 domain-containing protein [Candidatus Saccharimonadales bacterium]